jgi:hypothetical protein
MLFSTGEKTWYITPEGEAQRLGGVGSNPELKMPRYTSLSYETGELYVQSMDDLSGYLISDSDGDIYKIEKDFETEKIANDVYSSSLSKDGKTLYYLENTNSEDYDKGKDLFRAEVGSDDEHALVASDVMSFRLSDDETVYYYDDGGELYFIKGEDKPTRIDSDVEDIYMTHDGYLFYVADIDHDNSNGTLYACKNAEDKVKIDDDVYAYGVTATNNFTTYTKIIDSDLHEDYVAKSGTQFEMLLRYAPYYGEGGE